MAELGLGCCVPSISRDVAARVRAFWGGEFGFVIRLRLISAFLGRGVLEVGLFGKLAIWAEYGTKLGMGAAAQGSIR
jgi:hypothetical protein